ncbi:MAG: mechanosensitive ion channel family protein [Candidatus Cyclobacteriaceae bacterium M3_2C_046]
MNRFRQATTLTIALTGFLMMFFYIPDDGYSQDDQVPVQDQLPVAIEEDSSPDQATDEAITTLENMWNSFIFNYPKFIIALGCLLLAWLLTRLVKFILRKTLRNASSAAGIITLSATIIWLLAVGIALSILAGDLKALVGSFGLIGLALSWALQTPIESFTGWILNAFRGYYKVGDRVRVGEVFGDVYKIDFLSTTVWEIGSPYQPGFVSAEQSTGRLVTFPNNEILTGTVINLTGDFPYVWDELTMVVANESDLSLAIQVIEQKAQQIIGNYMAPPAREYARIIKKAGLPDEVSEKPQVYLSASESWTDVTVRYLVDARERRKWKTRLLLKLTSEINQEKYQNKILPVYPRKQIQFIDPTGIPVAPPQS